MQCPGCGLYHPARYDQCVSCGRRLDGAEEATAAPTHDIDEGFDDDADDDEVEEISARSRSGAKKKNQVTGSLPKNKGRKGIPVVGLVIAAGILLATAGGTYFFLSRPPESDRLLSEGQKELANGQFAFAQKTLEQARALKPTDPRILMSLARAYVGTDQVEKAWSCISEAQQSGPGVMTDPALTSDLAKYYVQRNQYNRAAELLRPLAQQNVPHKKTELSDLDALWGDACFAKGDTEQSQKCWEEIKSLGEGSRFNEVDTRLATIYQKMSNELLAKDDIEGALKCLNSLNTIAPSQQSFEKTSELYAKQDKLDLAIDQLRQAQKQGNGSREINGKLALLLSRRGKELLDKGDTETGYAYLQQAQSFDSSMKVPTVALRSVNMNVDNLAGLLHISGEAWNPGPNPVSYMSVKAELFDTKSSQTIWTKEMKVVDEFVPPMQAKDTKAFQLEGPLTGSQDGLELRLYLDGSMYKTYPLGQSGPKTLGVNDNGRNGSNNNGAMSSGQNNSGTLPAASAPSNTSSPGNYHMSAPNPASAGGTPSQNGYPPPAPAPTRQAPAPGNSNLPPLAPPINNPPSAIPSAQQQPGHGLSPEERTLKDLE